MTRAAPSRGPSWPESLSRGRRFRSGNSVGGPAHCRSAARSTTTSLATSGVPWRTKLRSTLS
eukprot:8019709-Pyramimonas_sp.AAC.1